MIEPNVAKNLTCLPEGVKRHSCRDRNSFLAHWMHKCQSAGMKMDAAIFVRPRRPVLQISFDGQANSRQLGPDLVMSPGFQLNLQQMVVIQALY